MTGRELAKKLRLHDSYGQDCVLHGEEITLAAHALENATAPAEGRGSAKLPAYSPEFGSAVKWSGPAPAGEQRRCLVCGEAVPAPFKLYCCGEHQEIGNNAPTEPPTKEPGDGEILDWLERELFERKWDGCLQHPCAWHMAGPYRHTLQKLRGATLREAVRDALRARVGRE